MRYFVFANESHSLEGTHQDSRLIEQNSRLIELRLSVIVASFTTNIETTRPHFFKTGKNESLDRLLSVAV